MIAPSSRVIKAFTQPVSGCQIVFQTAERQIRLRAARVCTYALSYFCFTVKRQIRACHHNLMWKRWALFPFLRCRGALKRRPQSQLFFLFAVRRAEQRPVLSVLCRGSRGAPQEAAPRNAGLQLPHQPPALAGETGQGHRSQAGLRLAGGPLLPGHSVCQPWGSQRSHWEICGHCESLC